MCGINGLFYKELIEEKEVKKSLTKMNNLIIHRGPDDDGIYIEKDKSYSLGMGMRRLAVIDLNTGKQPIYNDDNSIVIVFNGEIYNYKTLKIALENEGVVFKTASDTEVIIRLYEKYGVSAFGKLDGMFAFSIYDKNIDKLFIARDFFGEKPLYYTKTKEKFYWASELKSIIKILPLRPNISKEALSLYFQLTYIPAPYSIYQNIFKLEANNYLEVDCINFKIKINTIEQQFNSKYHNVSFEKAKEVTHNLVYNSVKSRAVSDVPIGTFLSGGVDSSIVSLCLSQQTSNPISTFSIGFDKKSFDETDKSRVVAKQLGSNHHEFNITINDLKNEIDDVLLNFDEPFADSSSLPTYMVSKLTQQTVKVALTGDGGDEVFGGYNKYYMGKLNKKYTYIVPEKAHNLFINTSKNILRVKDDNRGLRFKLNRLLKAINYDNDFYYNIISLGFQNNELTNLFKENNFVKEALDYFKDEDVINKLNDFRELDKKLSLEGDLLVKVDRASMLASIECRAPFLNKELWSFTNQLPESFLINGWNKKYILKEAFKQYFPKSFLDKSKKGFEIPVGDWLRKPLKKEVLSYIEPMFLKKQNIFNINYVQKLVLNHVEGREDNTFRVWTFYCFQKWYLTIFLNK
ncbi:MAG: asparagine synthase (glutamine-hydrolyzing) [Lutibacter sp.]|uniref:asparagine synthase (glutamine-hydrolyzing) n=1 Tax=Lutibacter sp. TaxID=1925666 RepID=UPI0018288587|nr:asparagine synthase (glutamine-hydrolyzing) [Lutibacter sp.]MBT8318067.1 asparagine synthase (glutamine-hydrolyzing) [Lutibacter sp.]NNJ58927.1 asparagine synthase (glutamine-hydrolyzing) [Lutibacter sp.]